MCTRIYSTFECWNFVFLIAIVFGINPIDSWAQEGFYEQQIIQQRNKKDKEFKKGKESPIPKPERRRFQGLYYFPVDSTYKVQATLVRDTSQKPFQMKTSTARVAVYRKYGNLHFELKGKVYQLPVYQSLDLMRNPMYKDYLFFPFTDATTGETTYEAGRYIDLKIPKDTRVFIDFNLAYNPYCAYSNNYSCPVTPVENQLPIAIEAGEKKYSIY